MYINTDALFSMEFQGIVLRRLFSLPLTCVKYSTQVMEDGCLIACPIFLCQNR